jgi:murein L,D-transpeptidase YafK
MRFRLTELLLVAFVFSAASIGYAEARKRYGGTTPVAIKAQQLAHEFEQRSLKLGSPVFIRVYKQTSEMELWVLQAQRYVHYKTYGICRWSGGLGPKMYEGDRQSPEGLYRITSQDLIVNQRWDRAMNINYPNTFDRENGRSGSSILIHGGCGSIGCFAIQNANVEEVYGAVRAALENGQAYIPVLALPFRFSTLAPDKQDTKQMSEFWSDLRRADLLFERDRLPPIAWVCDGRYFFADRRGDSHRHAVHMPGCRQLEKPAATARDAMKGKDNAQPSAAAALENPKKAVQAEAYMCDPKDVKCRLLHVAMKSPVICPQKYERCRTAKAAFTKSADCPLKYPRCRWFVGPEPKLVRSAANKTHLIRVKH